MSILLGFLLARGLAKVTVEINDKTMTISGSGVLMNKEFDEEYEKLNGIPNIETLKIKGSIYNIDTSTFSNGKQYPQLYTVETIELESVETLVDKVFHEYFKNIKTVKFGSKIRYIGDNFMGNPSQIVLDIPATVEKIHPRLLRWIKSFKLEPNNKYYSVCNEKDTQILLYANKEAIYGIADTTKPIDLVIPDCITTLDVINQEYNPNSENVITINSIDFNKVTTVRSNAFMKCKIADPSKFKLNLKNIKVLEENSLSILLGVSSLEIPASMEKIANGNLPYNSKITINKDNKNFKIKEVGKFKFITDSTESTYIHLDPIQLGEDETVDFEIGSSQVLYNNLFYMNKFNFMSVKLDCKIIPVNAFAENTIQHLTIGSNVEEIQSGAFKNCKIKDGEFNMKSVKTIGISSFRSSIIADSEGKAWLDLGLYCDTSKSAFENCDGIKSVIIYSENITIGESSFSECIRLESVKNAEGGYIGLIESNAFYICFKLIKLELTDNLISIHNGFPSSNTDKLFDENGIMYAGSNVALLRPVELKELNIEAKLLLPYSFYNYESPEASITFSKIEELRRKSFQNVNVKKITFGSSLKRISDYTFENVQVETIIFEGNSVECGEYAFIEGLNADNIRLPAVIQIPDSIEFRVNNILTPEIKINESNYKFTQEEVNGKKVDYLSLVDPKYEKIHLELNSNKYYLRVTRTVKYIGYSLSRTEFISVEFEEGIETLYKHFAFKVTLPKSLKNIAYYGSKENIKLNENFIWEGEFLLTKDKKTLCGLTPDGNLDKLPNVEVIGSYSLYSIPYRDSPSELKIPETTLKIMDNPFGYIGKIVLNDRIEEIGICNVDFDHFPASLKTISVRSASRLLGKVEKGSKLFTLENNVWYLNDAYFEEVKKKLKICVAIDDVNVEKVYLDFDTNGDMFKTISGGTIKEIELSPRTIQSPFIYVDIRGLENVNKFTPPANAFNYVNTAVKDNLTLTGYYAYNYDSGQREYFGASLNSDSIPAGVLHIFVKAPLKYPSGEQRHWPWIHVPKNLNLTPEDFGYMPIIYDQEDFVIPPDTESNQGSVQGLNGGEIAGIVIGVIIAVALIAFAVYWFVFRNKGDKTESSSSSNKDEASA